MIVSIVRKIFGGALMVSGLGCVLLSRNRLGVNLVFIGGLITGDLKQWPAEIDVDRDAGELRRRLQHELLKLPD